MAADIRSISPMQHKLHLLNFLNDRLRATMLVPNLCFEKKTSIECCDIGKLYKDSQVI